MTEIASKFQSTMSPTHKTLVSVLANLWIFEKLYLLQCVAEGEIYLSPNCGYLSSQVRVQKAGGLGQCRYRLSFLSLSSFTYSCVIPVTNLDKTQGSQYRGSTEPETPSILFEQEQRFGVIFMSYITSSIKHAHKQIIYRKHAQLFLRT